MESMSLKFDEKIKIRDDIILYNVITARKNTKLRVMGV